MSKPYDRLRVHTKTLSIVMTLMGLMFVSIVQPIHASVVALDQLPDETTNQDEASITPAGSGNGWVSLQNTGTETENIQGFSFLHNGKTYTLDTLGLVAGSSFELPAGSTFVVCDDNTVSEVSCNYFSSLISEQVEESTEEYTQKKSSFFSSVQETENEVEAESTPLVNIDTPSDGQHISGMFDIVGDISDPNITGYRVEILDSLGNVDRDVSYSTSSNQTDAVLHSDDSNQLAGSPEVFTIRVTAYGANPSVDIGSDEVEVTFDNDPPEVTVDSRETNDRTPELRGTVNDPTADIFVSIDGGTTLYEGMNNGDGTWSIEYPKSLEDGTYDVSVTATDLAGNNGYDTTTDELFIDGTAPKITVKKVTSFSHSPTLRGMVNDDTADIIVKVRGKTYAATNHGDGTWSLKGVRFTPNGVHGTYDVHAEATDAYGNVGNDKTENELTITGFIAGLSHAGGTFIGTITSASASASSDTDTDKKEDTEKSEKKDGDVASDDENQSFDWRWLILTGAIVAFLWFLLKNREAEA